MSASNYQKIQVIALAIALVLLIVFDFAGAYYRSSQTVRSGSHYDVSTDRYNPVYKTEYSYEYASVRLGSGYVESFMILLGIGALGYALIASIRGYKAGAGDVESMRENTRKATSGAKFAVGLAALGAIVFIWSYGDANDWWLDSGFYGTFFGGLLAIYSGKKTIKLLE